MHPAHAVEAALATYPADIHGMLSALPASDAGLTVQPIRNNPAGAQAVVDAEQAIIATPCASATPLDVGPGWRITWADGWWFLYGHLHARRDGSPDPASPLLLVNRLLLDAYFGAELAPLARRVLADTLAWHELNGEPWRPASTGSVG